MTTKQAMLLELKFGAVKSCFHGLSKRASYSGEGLKDRGRSELYKRNILWLTMDMSLPSYVDYIGSWILASVHPISAWVVSLSIGDLFLSSNICGFMLYIYTPLRHLILGTYGRRFTSYHIISFHFIPTSQNLQLGTLQAVKVLL